MNIETIINQLEAEWDFTSPHGFFSKIRGGELDLVGFERVKDLLNKIPSSDSEIESKTINRRIVELVWFMPTFLHWRRSIWVERGEDTDDLDDVINYFEQRITTILGLP